MTVDSAIAEFIKACQADGLSKNTTDWYIALLGRFGAAYGSVPLRDVSASDMRTYIIGIDHEYDNDSTRAAHRRALHRFWKWCSVEYNILNPMRNIAYPKVPQQPPHAADLDDLIAMFNAAGDGLAGDRDRAMLAFLIDTGCRSMGLYTLTPANLDLENRRAFVTEKGGKSRAVRFIVATAVILSIWMDRREPVDTVFYNLNTLGPLTRSGVYRAMRRLALRAGVKGRYNPHSIRHTFAHEYIKAGGDLARLSKLLGHRDVKTTIDHYLLFVDQEIDEAHQRYSPGRKLSDEPSDNEGK